jgi:dethiobiotin synthetase
MLFEASSSGERLRGVFVTGTGTEVGKTVVASVIAATLSARGERVAVFKPAVTGLAELGTGHADHDLLRLSSGSHQKPEAIAPYCFGPAVSPHLAAELAGVRIDPAQLLNVARDALHDATALVAEGVGGLMVPLTPHYLVRNLAVDLGMPIVIVASPDLGTINHTLLTIEAARTASLDIASVVLSPWPEQPNEMQLSNRITIASRGRVPVYGLPYMDTSAGFARPVHGSLADSLLEAIPVAEHGLAA